MKALALLFFFFCSPHLRAETFTDRIVEKLVEITNDVTGLRLVAPSTKLSIRNRPEQRASGHPEVNTTSGLVIGSTLQESHAFYSIPYGEAPVGSLRYKPPVRVSYRGRLNTSVPDYLSCFEYPTNCTSDEDCEKNYSEDCLVLTISVPSAVDLSAPPRKLLPVMFWIHGGAFFAGSGNSPIYDSRWLSNSTNTVIVNINYRLGALGFLVYEENGETLDGNQGIKDQQLALRWVHDNIEKFGGDKNKVTIFGESAGGQSALFHLMSSESNAYFHRVIMESNPASYYYPSIAEAKLKADALLKELDCTGSGLQCLRDSSAVVIMEAFPAVAASEVIDFFNIIEPFRPNLDEVEFTEQPLDFFQSGKWQNNKEVIIGTNTEEIDILNVIFQNAVIGRASFEAFTTFVVGPKFAPAVIEKYSELAGSNPGIRYDYTDILGQEISDMVFVCPSRTLARFMSSTSSQDQPPIYLYSFAHSMNGSNCEDISPFCGYAHHGAELVFVFDTAHVIGFVTKEDDEAVIEMLSNFWGHFAYFGTPSTDAQEWPRYISKASTDGTISPWTNVLIQAPNSVIESGYRKDLCDFWDSLGFYVNVTSPTISPTEPTTTSTSTNLSYYFSFLSISSFLACLNALL